MSQEQTQTEARTESGNSSRRSRKKAVVYRADTGVCFWVILITVFWVFANQFAPATFLPSYLERTAGLVEWQIGLLFALFPFASFIMSPACGMFLKRLGPEKSQIVGLLVCTAATVVFGLWEQIWVFYLMRAVQGAAVALYAESMYVLVARMYPDDVPYRVGLTETSIGLGCSLGRVIGELYSFGFAVPFLFISGILLFAALISALAFRKPLPTSTARAVAPALTANAGSPQQTAVTSTAVQPPAQTKASNGHAPRPPGATDAETAPVRPEAEYLGVPVSSKDGKKNTFQGRSVDRQGLVQPLLPQPMAGEGVSATNYLQAQLAAAAQTHSRAVHFAASSPREAARVGGNGVIDLGSLVSPETSPNRVPKDEDPKRGSFSGSHRRTSPKEKEVPRRHSHLSSPAQRGSSFLSPHAQASVEVSSDHRSVRSTQTLSPMQALFPGAGSPVARSLARALHFDDEHSAAEVLSTSSQHHRRHHTVSSHVLNGHSPRRRAQSLGPRAFRDQHGHLLPAPAVAFPSKTSGPPMQSDALNKKSLTEDHRSMSFPPPTRAQRPSTAGQIRGGWGDHASGGGKGALAGLLEGGQKFLMQSGGKSPDGYDADAIPAAVHRSLSLDSEGTRQRLYEKQQKGGGNGVAIGVGGQGVDVSVQPVTCEYEWDGQAVQRMGAESGSAELQSHAQGEHHHVSFVHVLRFRVMAVGVMVLMSASTYTFFDPVLEPHLQREFGPLSGFWVGVVMGLQSLMYMGASILCGIFASKYRRYAGMGIIGMLLCALGYISLGPAPFIVDLGFMKDHTLQAWAGQIGGQTLVALGNAMTFVPAVPWMHLFVEDLGDEGEELCIALVVGFMSLGEAASPLLSGFLTSQFGYGWACVAFALIYTSWSFCTWVIFFDTAPPPLSATESEVDEVTSAIEQGHTRSLKVPLCDAQSVTPSIPESKVSSFRAHHHHHHAPASPRTVVSMPAPSFTGSLFKLNYLDHHRSPTQHSRSPSRDSRRAHGGFLLFPRKHSMESASIAERYSNVQHGWVPDDDFEDGLNPNEHGGELPNRAFDVSFDIDNSSIASPLSMARSRSGSRDHGHPPSSFLFSSSSQSPSPDHPTPVPLAHHPDLNSFAPSSETTEQGLTGHPTTATTSRMDAQHHVPAYTRPHRRLHHHHHRSPQDRSDDQYHQTNVNVPPGFARRSHSSIPTAPEDSGSTGAGAGGGVSSFGLHSNMRREHSDEGAMRAHSAALGGSGADQSAHSGNGGRFLTLPSPHSHHSHAPHPPRSSGQHHPTQPHPNPVPGSAGDTPSSSQAAPTSSLSHECNPILETETEEAEGGDEEERESTKVQNTGRDGRGS
uniref:Major facilitator superfamily (MFS) profile domain-containing protein n=1 Tax=Chromera velia CCMP2878 TaxID=1169474 RepID=A0A0G4I7H9_9ALVE|eukprot:Cvel_11641.t1-p1 / transcript=Cvel_11641.t1 / gene=Cvel_11641 / organism=Chromera_velia_CCMP2878 / gene_product=hypothetical protein / transcript_product=hypothetical protein / location=Cvel_scaffold737:38994-46268(-) / protein_length=1333 / sequence_SO=supercontig / SO=protein_coding / is_pseudo=false